MRPCVESSTARFSELLSIPSASFGCDRLLRTPHDSVETLWFVNHDHAAVGLPELRGCTAPTKYHAFVGFGFWTARMAFSVEISSDVSSVARCVMPGTSCSHTASCVQNTPFVTM